MYNIYNTHTHEHQHPAPLPPSPTPHTRIQAIKHIFKRRREKWIEWSGPQQGNYTYIILQSLTNLPTAFITLNLQSTLIL